jgi:ornithine carbamoyltransferase
MSYPVSPFHLGRFDALSAPQRQALLDRALALEHEAQGGRDRQPLRGRNIGLLTEAPAGAEAQLFSRAALGLGARVARIQPLVAELEQDEALRTTARMLGRLYDAIECQGLPPPLVERIRAQAGVPVYDDLAGAALADAPDSGSRENRFYVIQAVLLASLGGA